MKWWHIIFHQWSAYQLLNWSAQKRLLRGGGEMKDEIKVSLPLFSLLYNPAILFEVHQEPQQPKILTPGECTAERIINKRRLQQVRECGGACGRVVNTSKFGSEGPRFKPCPSRCFLRQETLLHFVSLHPPVYGYWRHTAGGNPAMD